MKEKLKTVLAKTGALLNQNEILWGVGASVLLHQYNLVNNPNDIDIIIQETDIEKTDRILTEWGVKSGCKNNNSKIYSTDFFCEYNISGIDVDVMAGFKINIRDNKTYEYEFGKDSVPHYFLFDDIRIPFMTLEDWYILYQLMPEREYKVKLIEKHFLENGIEYPIFLEKAIKNLVIPDNIKTRISVCLYTDKNKTEPGSNQTAKFNL